MSLTERTKYRRSLDPLAFDEPRRGPQHAPYPSRPSTDFSVDSRVFAPLGSSQRTNILTRVVAGGLVVSAFGILVAIFSFDVTRVLIDKLASVNASAPRSGTPSREDVVSAYHTALQSQAPAARGGNEAAAPPKTLDAETLAALMTRAKSLLALGDIAAARLLLERAANAQDASAAFLLAQTYDPAVLGVRDTRSIRPDPVMARDWYRKAASLGSADAQHRLAQLHN